MLGVGRAEVHLLLQGDHGVVKVDVGCVVIGVHLETEIELE